MQTVESDTLRWPLQHKYRLWQEISPDSALSTKQPQEGNGSEQTSALEVNWPCFLKA